MSKAPWPCKNGRDCVNAVLLSGRKWYQTKANKLLPVVSNPEITKKALQLFFFFLGLMEKENQASR